MRAWLLRRGQPLASDDPNCYSQRRPGSYSRSVLEAHGGARGDSLDEKTPVCTGPPGEKEHPRHRQLIVINCIRGWGVRLCRPPVTQGLKNYLLDYFIRGEKSKMVIAKSEFGQLAIGDATGDISNEEEGTEL